MKVFSLQFEYGCVIFKKFVGKFPLKNIKFKQYTDWKWITLVVEE